MSGVFRSLKYASFRAGRVLGTAALMSIAFVLYFTLIAGEAFTVQNLVMRIPEVLVFIGCLMFMIYGMLDFVTYTQLTLSYGTTRKHAMISLIYMDLIQVAVMTVLVWLVFYLSPSEWMPASTAKAVGMAQNIFLVASALSMINGMLIYRFGKIAYYIFVLVAAIGGGIMGGMTSYLGHMTVLGDLWQIGGLSVLNLAGAVVFVIASVICWLFIRKTEVRV